MCLYTTSYNLTVLIKSVHNFFLFVSLKGRNHAGYANLLNSLSIHISFMSVRWSTAGLNSLLVRLAGSKGSQFFRNWYSFGTYIALLLLLPSITLLVAIATKSLLSISQGTAVSSENEMILQPVVPGVNLPQSQLAHYFITIFICTVFHEMGHALAAVKYAHSYFKGVFINKDFY